MCCHIMNMWLLFLCSRNNGILDLFRTRNMVLASLMYLDSFNRYIVLSILLQSFDGLEKVMDSTEPILSSCSVLKLSFNYFKLLQKVLILSRMVICIITDWKQIPGCENFPYQLRKYCLKKNQ